LRVLSATRLLETFNVYYKELQCYILVFSRNVIIKRGAVMRLPIAKKLTFLVKAEAYGLARLTDLKEKRLHVASADIQTSPLEYGGKVVLQLTCNH
jgi:hypothetical protein